MESKKLLKNVVVFNGVLEHQIKYYHSPKNIKNVVIWILTHLPDDFIEEINEANLKLYIRTNYDYSVVEFMEIESSERELALRFKEFTSIIF
jgi:hypothetical protein